MSKETQIPQSVKDWIVVKSEKHQSALRFIGVEMNNAESWEAGAEALYTHLLSQGWIREPGDKDLVASDTALIGKNCDASVNKTSLDWTRIEDGLPDFDSSVLIETNFLVKGHEYHEYFVGHMNENGDTIVHPHDEDYGWAFKDCVARWIYITSLIRFNKIVSNSIEQCAK